MLEIDSGKISRNFDQTISSGITVVSGYSLLVKACSELV